jgi:hypothetical protein
LIRMKALDDWRVGGRFLLAIDGWPATITLPPEREVL